MELIEVIGSFERYLENNPLPQATQLLWYKVISLGGYENYVEIHNTDLAKKMNCSVNTMLSAREELIKAGLIHYESNFHMRGKGRYKAKPLTDSKTLVERVIDNNAWVEILNYYCDKVGKIEGNAIDRNTAMRLTEQGIPQDIVKAGIDSSYKSYIKKGERQKMPLVYCEAAIQREFKKSVKGDINNDRQQRSQFDIIRGNKEDDEEYTPIRGNADRRTIELYKSGRTIF